MKPAALVLVTPALADANNGNWQTAQRWARMLRRAYRVHLQARWSAEDAGRDDALMIALHARRSAESIATFKAAYPHRPVVLALTGTDLYRDIASDAAAQRSLALADRLIVLNSLGAQALPEALRPKVSVVLQSCSARAPRPRPQQHTRVLMVGHLRAEKDPATYQRAAVQLAHRSDLLFDHIGAALEPAWAKAAELCMARQPRYRWLGGLPHGATRERMTRASVLVHASRLEGGAHVVIEALRSGLPVLASRIDGNVGLLGSDYDGYFPAGDATALAGLVGRFADDTDFAQRLTTQCTARADRFSPEAEAAALGTIVSELLG
ncbi:glycosyl transferase family 1 [beta proteobacterium AAP99]|nr:glycosyl transferase family 1 [beta proteobacterium AAP99]